MFKPLLESMLGNLAKQIIKKYKPDIIGITGSIGKSSSKEAIAAVLGAKFSVGFTAKNYNNEIGVPLTVMGVRNPPGGSVLGWLAVLFKAKKLLLTRDDHFPEVLVLEMGADKPGDIAYLTDIAPCKVGVLTFISHAHTEFFKTIKKIAQEKRIIISHLRQDGFAVLNYDNDVVMQNIGATKAEVITYGFKEGADLRATDINVVTDEKTHWPVGLNFKVLYKGSVVPVFLPRVIAKPAISAALSGLAVGTIFGINVIEGSQALSALEGLPGRMKLVEGIKGTLIIDDTYNASPEACRSALDALAHVEVRSGARRFVALGDMLELGPETENAHRELGFRVAELGFDFLITVGEAAKHVAQAAREAGIADDRIASFAASGEAGRFLQEKIASGDVVLVKGSQGIRMEKMVKEIMNEPLRAEAILCRQGKEWV